MTIKLYGFPLSTASSRVYVVLYELGVEFELVPIRVPKGEHKDPEYLKLQPFGQIPVLEDGDIRIFESRAIMRYLAEQYAEAGKSLLGETVKEKALVQQWLEVEAQNYSEPVHKVLRETEVFRKFNPLAVPDAARRAQYLAKLGQVLDIYDAHLAENKYLAGDSVSLADLAHLPSTTFLLFCSEEAKQLYESRKHVSAWLTDLNSRPSWQRVFADLAPHMKSFAD